MLLRHSPPLGNRLLRARLGAGGNSRHTADCLGHGRAVVTALAVALATALLPTSPLIAAPAHAAQDAASAEDSSAPRTMSPAELSTRIESARNPRTPPALPQEPVVVDPDWLGLLLTELHQSAEREQALRSQLRAQQYALGDSQRALEQSREALAASREALQKAQQGQAVLSHHLAQSQLRLAERDARLGLLEQQLTMVATMRDQILADLGQAQLEITQLRQQVAFFERLVPDGNSQGRISIRSAELSPLGDTLLQYRVLVMRNQASDDTFRGRLQFLATGELDGSSATIPLERLVDDPTSEPSDGDAEAAARLQFRQYQRASGLLAMPPGFVPDTVTVRVLEGRSVRAEHTISLARESQT